MPAAVIKATNAASFIIAKDKDGVRHFLVIIEKNGKINIPGGQVERCDRDGLVGALRELIEETSNNSVANIELIDLKHLSCNKIHHHRGDVTEIHTFSYDKIIDPKLMTITNKETRGTIWARCDYFAALIDNGTLNDADKYRVYRKNYQLRSCLVSTLKRFRHLLDTDF